MMCIYINRNRRFSVSGTVTTNDSDIIIRLDRKWAVDSTVTDGARRSSRQRQPLTRRMLLPQAGAGCLQVQVETSAFRLKLPLTLDWLEPSRPLLRSVTRVRRGFLPVPIVSSPTGTSATAAARLSLPLPVLVLSALRLPRAEPRRPPPQPQLRKGEW